MIRHAGLIALRVGGTWRGVLIEGASGSGKSDLALRALDCGFRLVADDRVLVFASDGRLWGRAPRSLTGMIEVRGVGVLRRDNLPFAHVAAMAVCVADAAAVERFPEPASESVAGVPLPRMSVWPFEPSAPLKLRAALERLGAEAQQGYQARFAPAGRRVGP